MKIQQSITNYAPLFDKPLDEGVMWRVSIVAGGPEGAVTHNVKGEGADIEGARQNARLALAEHGKAVLEALAAEK